MASFTHRLWHSARRNTIRSSSLWLKKCLSTHICGCAWETFCCSLEGPTQMFRLFMYFCFDKLNFRSWNKLATLLVLSIWEKKVCLCNLSQCVHFSSSFSREKNKSSFVFISTQSSDSIWRASKLGQFRMGGWSRMDPLKRIQSTSILCVLCKSMWA